MLPFWALISGISETESQNSRSYEAEHEQQSLREKIIEMNINQIFRRTGSSVRRISTLLEASAVEMDKYKKMLSKSSPVEIEDFKTKFEPYKIKMVEPIHLTDRKTRIRELKKADYNLFGLPSEAITLDFLTDSGTGSMSSMQWSKMMIGDESYAGASSFKKFHDAVQDLFNFDHILPVHQGRAAERILFAALGGPGKLIPNNTHFDTTRANIEATQAKALDLPAFDTDDFFRGNMDVGRLRELFISNSEDIPCCMLTITNNSAGGQPVSLQNIRETSKLCKEYGIPLFLDACRFAENAYFIKQYEDGMNDFTIPEIVRMMAAECDGMTMSAKKDAICNTGGWLALNDPEIAARCKEMLILTEGFLTYGGLCGRDLEAVAQGLKEVVQEDYLAHRIRSTREFGEKLTKVGFPLVEPVGGHALYIDAAQLLPDHCKTKFPGHAVAISFYIEGGIRSCEIGSLMFGDAALNELVRFAIPRRVYTQSHFDYAVEVAERVYERAISKQLPEYEIIEQPKFLRHFSAKLRPQISEYDLDDAATNDEFRAKVNATAY